MSQSPLQIEFYAFRRIHLEVKEGVSMELQTTSVQASPEVKVTSTIGRHPEEQNRFRVDLSIAGGQADKDYPISFEMDVVGFFSVVDGYPADQVELLAQINGSSILYSAAREFLAGASGRFGHPAILLQSVSFVPQVEPKADSGDQRVSVEGRKSKVSSKPKSPKKVRSEK